MSTWTDWDGGECPIDDWALVMVRFRGKPSREYGPKVADTLFWHHDGRWDDIVAYQVVES